MNTKTDPKIFPKNKNEGKVNSKGMVAPPVPSRAPETKLSSQEKKVAPPVPPKSHQAKFAGIRAKFEENGHNKTVIKRTFGPTMQKLMEDDIPNKQRRISSYNAESIQTVSDILSKGINDSTPCLTPKRTTENMLFVGGVNDSTPCLKPQNSKVSIAAGNELETIKFLKTLSKEERENLDLSSKQQNNQKVEVSNPLDWNPIYKDKKRFSPDRLNVHPLLHNNAEMHGNITSGTRPYSVTEKCMVTHDGSELGAKMERKHGFQQDLNVKHTKADTVVCSITKGNDKKDVRPDEQEPLSEVSKVNVKELVNRFRG